MRVLRTWQCDLSKELRNLRGDVLEGETTEESKKKTQRVFGQPLSPIEVVRKILQDVKTRGDEAVLYYTETLDGITLKPQDLRVKNAEIEEAYSRVSSGFLKALQKARESITAFQRHIQIKPQGPLYAGNKSLEAIYRPLDRVGIYVPGGAASYPSTVLMCAVPAKVAGVERVIMATPPGRDGSVSPDRLVAAREAGVHEIYKIGGVQAIAALSFGTDTVPRVDKVVGPGNLFVTLAKKEVFGYVDIDMLAGPSEAVILADDSAEPGFVASDLLSQAEHYPGISILITWCEELVEKVLEEIKSQLGGIKREAQAREALEKFGAVIVTTDMEEAIEVANRIAPEHIELILEDVEDAVPRIRHAGAVFLGDYSPVAAGDYIAGPSHVLPTGGTARFFSGLSVNDFLRSTSVISYSKDALAKAAEDIVQLAETEGLDAHARSVEIRLKNLELIPEV